MPRVMEIVTPLGEDVLLFHGMSAREEMSRPFEYKLDLLSGKHDIKLDDILGKNVNITLGLPDDKTRYFNGYVTRFSAGGTYGRYYRYIATVRPWLWFLTRTADCRIFQDMKVPDIIKAVFSDHGFADFKLELTAAYRKWTYCVQYRETDFNFVSRLMEQEGIGYYFRHTDGHNTMVLTDSTGKHSPVAGYEKLSYIAPMQQVKPDTEHIHAWDFGREIQPGLYVHDDYDLERPSVELKTSKPLPRDYSPSDYEIYDYPGLYIQKADGEQYASVRVDELGTNFELIQAATNARGLTVGAILTLEHHTRDDQNRDYLITGASYDLSFEDYESLPEASGTGYRCAFVAMPAAQQFRPKRITPKPFVQGPQTAVVVGPGGRGDLHRQVRPREGAVPLGPARQEGREQLVLDPRVAPVGGQELGRDRDATHRAGSHRRFPRRRSRSADHHRPRLQRRADAAVRPAGEHDAVGRQEPQLEGRRPGELQRNPDGRQEGLGAALHPCGEEPGHRGRERRDALGRPRSDEDDRSRRDEPHQARSDGDRRQQRDDHGSWAADGDRRQERDDHDSHESHRDGRLERDDQHRRESHDHGEPE